MEGHIINDWFLSLPKSRQEILLEDKWLLASAFGEHVHNEYWLTLLQTKSVLEKVKSHNKLTPHDEEMIRQLLEVL